ncbi:MAG: EamA family transporter [Caulobacter sp.]|nr:EamA family transporter [Caulobacter sp.]
MKSSRSPLNQALPLIALVGGACAIAFAPIFVRLAETGPAAAGFWRLTLALPILAVIALAARKGDRAQPLSPGWPALAAGLLFAADLACWHYGIVLTSVSNATVLANLTPIAVTAVAWIAFREAPRRLFLAGLALGLAGAWTMAEARGVAAPGRDPPLGDLLSAITALWYAGYFIAVRKARSVRMASVVMFWSSLAGAPILLAIAVLLGEPVLPASAAGWWACLGLGVVHVVGQGAIAWALGRLPTATASVVVLVQPVVAATLGWLLFHEALTPLQAVGAVVCLGGVALAQWASARPATA